MAKNPHPRPIRDPNPLREAECGRAPWTEDGGGEHDTHSSSDSRHRRGSQGSSRRNWKSEDSSGSEFEEERSRKKRKITAEEIIEYVPKKSQKKRCIFCLFVYLFFDSRLLCCILSLGFLIVLVLCRP